MLPLTRLIHAPLLVVVVWAQNASSATGPFPQEVAVALGFWAPMEDPQDILRCPEAGVCPGGGLERCASGRGGIACAECLDPEEVPGAFGGPCLACKDLPLGGCLPFLLLLVFWTFLPLPWSMLYSYGFVDEESDLDPYGFTRRDHAFGLSRNGQTAIAIHMVLHALQVVALAVQAARPLSPTALEVLGSDLQGLLALLLFDASALRPLCVIEALGFPRARTAGLALSWCLPALWLLLTGSLVMFVHLQGCFCARLCRSRKSDDNVVKVTPSTEFEGKTSIQVVIPRSVSSRTSKPMLLLNSMWPDRLSNALEIIREAPLIARWPQRTQVFECFRIFLYTFLAPLVHLAARAFVCSRHPGGTHTWAEHPALSCEGQLPYIAIPLLLVYAIFPTIYFMFFFCGPVRDKGATKAAVDAVALELGESGTVGEGATPKPGGAEVELLQSQTRPRLWAWPLMVVLRNALAGALPAMVPPSGAACTLVALEAFYWAALCRGWPWCTPSLNRLDCVLTALAFGVCLATLSAPLADLELGPDAGANDDGAAHAFLVLLVFAVVAALAQMVRLQRTEPNLAQIHAEEMADKIGLATELMQIALRVSAADHGIYKQVIDSIPSEERPKVRTSMSVIRERFLGHSHVHNQLEIQRWQSYEALSSEWMMRFMQNSVGTGSGTAKRQRDGDDFYPDDEEDEQNLDGFHSALASRRVSCASHYEQEFSPKSSNPSNISSRRSSTSSLASMRDLLGWNSRRGSVNLNAKRGSLSASASRRASSFAAAASAGASRRTSVQETQSKSRRSSLHQSQFLVAPGEEAEEKDFGPCDSNGEERASRVHFAGDVESNEPDASGANGRGTSIVDARRRSRRHSDAFKQLGSGVMPKETGSIGDLRKDSTNKLVPSPNSADAGPRGILKSCKSVDSLESLKSDDSDKGENSAGESPKVDASSSGPSHWPGMEIDVSGSLGQGDSQPPRAIADAIKNLAAARPRPNGDAPPVGMEESVDQASIARAIHVLAAAAEGTGMAAARSQRGSNVGSKRGSADAGTNGVIVPEQVIAAAAGAGARSAKPSVAQPPPEEDESGINPAELENALHALLSVMHGDPFVRRGSAELQPRAAAIQPLQPGRPEDDFSPVTSLESNHGEAQHGLKSKGVLNRLLSLSGAAARHDSRESPVPAAPAAPLQIDHVEGGGSEGAATDDSSGDAMAKWKERKARKKAQREAATTGYGAYLKSMVDDNAANATTTASGPAAESKPAMNQLFSAGQLLGKGRGHVAASGAASSPVSLFSPEAGKDDGTAVQPDSGESTDGGEVVMPAALRRHSSFAKLKEHQENRDPKQWKKWMRNSSVSLFERYSKRDAKREERRSSDENAAEEDHSPGDDGSGPEPVPAPAQSRTVASSGLPEAKPAPLALEAAPPAAAALATLEAGSFSSASAPGAMLPEARSLGEAVAENPEPAAPAATTGAEHIPNTTSARSVMRGFSMASMSSTGSSASSRSLRASVMQLMPNLSRRLAPFTRPALVAEVSGEQDADLEEAQEAQESPSGEMYSMKGLQSLLPESGLSTVNESREVSRRPSAQPSELEPSSSFNMMNLKRSSIRSSVTSKSSPTSQPEQTLQHSDSHGSGLHATATSSASVSGFAMAAARRISTFWGGGGGKRSIRDTVGSKDAAQNRIPESDRSPESASVKSPASAPASASSDSSGSGSDEEADKLSIDPSCLHKDLVAQMKPGPANARQQSVSMVSKVQSVTTEVKRRFSVSAAGSAIAAELDFARGRRPSQLLGQGDRSHSLSLLPVPVGGKNGTVEERRPSLGGRNASVGVGHVAGRRQSVASVSGSPSINGLAASGDWLLPQNSMLRLVTSQAYHGSTEGSVDPAASQDLVTNTAAKQRQRREQDQSSDTEQDVHPQEQTSGGEETVDKPRSQVHRKSVSAWSQSQWSVSTNDMLASELEDIARDRDLTLKDMLSQQAEKDSQRESLKKLPAAEENKGADMQSERPDPEAQTAQTPSEEGKTSKGSNTSSAVVSRAPSQQSPVAREQYGSNTSGGPPPSPPGPTPLGVRKTRPSSDSLASPEEAPPGEEESPEDKEARVKRWKERRDQKRQKRQERRSRPTSSAGAAQADWKKTYGSYARAEAAKACGLPYDSNSDSERSSSAMSNASNFSVTSSCSNAVLTERAQVIRAEDCSMRTSQGEAAVGKPDAEDQPQRRQWK